MQIDPNMGRKNGKKFLNSKPHIYFVKKKQNIFPWKNIIYILFTLITPSDRGNR